MFLHEIEGFQPHPVMLDRIVVVWILPRQLCTPREHIDTLDDSFTDRHMFHRFPDDVDRIVVVAKGQLNVVDILDVVPLEEKLVVTIDGSDDSLCGGASRD